MTINEKTTIGAAIADAVEHDRMLREWIACERREMSSLPDGMNLEDAMSEADQVAMRSRFFKADNMFGV